MQHPGNKLARRNLAFVLSMATVLGVLTFTSSAIAQGQSDGEAAVRRVLVEDAAAFERGDIASLDRIWANDESVLVFESGHANYGWTDYRDNHLVPEMKEIKNTKYTLTDIKVHMAGTTAWATFKYAIAGDIGTRHIDSGGLGTAVLEQRDNRWQIVHWHSSAPRRAPAQTATPAKKR